MLINDYIKNTNIGGGHIRGAFTSASLVVKNENLPNFGKCKAKLNSKNGVSEES